MKRAIACLAIGLGIFAATIATATPASAVCVSVRVGLNGRNLVNAQPLVCVP